MSKKTDKMIQDQLNQLNSYISGIKPDAGITGEGDYAKNLIGRIRGGEDISTLLPGEMNLVKQMSMNNAEVSRTLKGAGNNAFGGVDPNLQAQLDTEYSLESEKGAADTYSNLLMGEEGQAEDTIFNAGNYATGVEFNKANAMNSAFQNTVSEAKRQDEAHRSKWASIFGAIGMGVGAFTGLAPFMGLSAAKPH